MKIQISSNQNSRCTVSELISINEAISFLDTNELKNLIIIDSSNTFKGYTDIYELRRLLISGVREDEKLKNLKFRNDSFTAEQLNDSVFISKMISANERDYIPFIIVTDALQKIVNIIPTQEVFHKIGLDDTSSKIGSNIANVLVIGGAGYLGTILTQKLLENSYKVRILDSFIYGERPIEQFKHNSDISIIKGDIRNIETVIQALENIDCVILLAAIVGDPASKIRPSQTIQTNYLAAQMVAASCKLQNINRFVYTSTCSVYGVSDSILDENSSLNPVSLYARTKIASEQSILSLCNDNFSPTILRMSTLYGYSPRMRFDLVVNTMTLKAYQENKITVFGGNQWRPLLNVNDAANAFIKVLQADINKIKGKIYNVGSEQQNYKIKDLANIVSSSLGGIPINTENSAIDARNYRVSFEKIRNELRFSVEHNVENAIQDIYDKLSSHKINNPNQKVFYNHFFDSAEEK